MGHCHVDARPCCYCCILQVANQTAIRHIGQHNRSIVGDHTSLARGVLTNLYSPMLKRSKTSKMYCCCLNVIVRLFTIAIHCDAK
jgi:hypothetical protein